MSETKLAAEARTEFGKGAARRIRRADKVPAVLYGRGADPIHVTLPGHDAMMALKNSNALLSIELDGESHLSIPKDVQRDPLKGFLEHVDLLIVKKGEKVTVDVDVVVEGEAAPESLVVLENSTITLEVDPTSIPESVEVDVEGLEPGSQIHASDIKLRAGASLAVDAELLIVNITNAPTAADIEAELEEAEAEAGIEHDEPDTDPAAEAADPELADASTDSGNQD